MENALLDAMHLILHWGIQICLNVGDFSFCFFM